RCMNLKNGLLRVVSFVSLIIILTSFFVPVDAFAPRPPDVEKTAVCENTGGEVVSRSFSPDCGPNCSAAWSTVVYCKCPNQVIWGDFERMDNWAGCDTLVTLENENHLISESQFNEEMKIQGKQDSSTTTELNLDPSVLVGSVIAVIIALAVIVVLFLRKKMCKLY
ncbi:MAG: hypothetical protein KAS30_05560, partial [Candidatus Diapherotrites archaeon]|nr:hypothetical protein [Candidatus Diapherotrites archaeon]